MSDPMLNPEQLPDDPDASPMYRLLLRPKPGSDVIRNLRHALKALGRRYGLDVIEIRPVEDKPRQRKVTHEERQARHRATPVYQFFGQNIPRPPEGWPR
jgi:hypothetical protein